MKSRFLFPHKYKGIGWVLTIPSMALGLANQIFNFQFRFLDLKFLYPPGKNFPFDWNFTDEVASLGLIVGLLFIAFSKEKVEDEQIAKVRLESLQWTVYFNYFVLMLAIIFVHGFMFLNVMIYNMFTVLVFFIIRFYYILYVQRRLGEDAT